jgi:hypothetical protein
MAVGGEVESNNCFLDRKINLLLVAMKHGRLVVFIRHGSAEIKLALQS